MKKLFVFLVIGLGACQSEGNMDDAARTREIAVPPTIVGSPAPIAAPAASTVTRPSVDNTRIPTVLFFGTSLTAGYGIPSDQAFPSVIQRRAAQAGIRIHGVNAGLSGETSAGALRRIDWVLRTPVDVIVIETGANDALRGISVESARSNVEQIVAIAKRAQPNAKIVLLEMLAPPNLGPAYTIAFQDIFSSVAARERITLVPFFLEGVAGRPEMNQGDGMHPNAAGAKLAAENVWRVLKPVIQEVAQSRQQ